MKTDQAFSLDVGTGFGINSRGRNKKTTLGDHEEIKVNVSLKNGGMINGRKKKEIVQASEQKCRGRAP